MLPLPSYPHLIRVSPLRKLSSFTQRTIYRRPRKKKEAAHPGRPKGDCNEDIYIERSDQKSIPPMPPPAGMAAAPYLLRLLGDHRLGGDQQAGDRGGVLQSGAHDLGRVDDAGLRTGRTYSLGLGVEAEVVVVPRSACRRRSSHRRRHSRRSGEPEPAGRGGRSRYRRAGRRWRA